MTRLFPLLYVGISTFFISSCIDDDKKKDCLPGTCGEPQDCGDAGLDGDGDGYVSNDCDDSDCTINPGGQEICDGDDNDCDGAVDYDMDGDLKSESDYLVLDAYIDMDTDGVCGKEHIAVCSNVAEYTTSSDPITYFTDEVEEGFVKFAFCGWGWSPVDPDIYADTRDGFQLWYSDDEVDLLLRFLMTNNESELLGPDKADYWDDCEMGDESACLLRDRPDCQYSEVVGYDDDLYPDYELVDEDEMAVCRG